MKPLSRLIKGMLISLMVAMMFNLGVSFVLPSTVPLAAKQAFAEEYAGDICDPHFENTNYDKEACDAKIAEEKANEPEAGSFEAKVATIEPPIAPGTATTSDKFVEDVVDLANKVHRLFAPLINFFSFQIGNFLGHDYIYGGPMGEMLQKIWVISRNIVNIAFVFLLLWMALKEIFFLNQESELKKNLIKFTLLLIAVNFSWLGTKVVLDAASVATHVVFAIPSGISDPPGMASATELQCKVNDPEEPISGVCYPTTIFAPTDSGTNNPLYWEDSEGEEEDDCYKVKKSYEDAYQQEGQENPGARKDEKELTNKDNKKFWGRTSICMENLNFTKYDQNTAVIYLTYGMARIQNLVGTHAGDDIVQLSVGILLSLFIQLAYTIALLALFLALIIRMMMLWFFVGFSPFLVLLIWFKGAEDQDFGEAGGFGIRSFAKWAFVPAKVGAVFAVSFIMISTGQSVGDFKTVLFDKVASKSGFVFKMLEPQSLFMGIGSLQSFIWLIMSVVILWLGVFAVLGDMPIIKHVSNRINDYGKGVARLVATSPYWAPIVPLGEGGKTSMKEMLGKVDLRTKLEGYADIGRREQEVRTLNAKAGKFNIGFAMDKLGPGGTGLTSADAKRIATGYGYHGDVGSMLKSVHEKTLKKAFAKSINFKDGKEDDLYKALRRFEREKAPETPPARPAAEKAAPLAKPAGPAVAPEETEAQTRARVDREQAERRRLDAASPAPKRDTK